MSLLQGNEYRDLPIWQRVSQCRLRTLPWQRDEWHDRLRSGKPLRNLLILDAHAHLGEYTNFYMNQPTEDSMVEVMDRIGMRAAVIASNPAISSDPEYGNNLTAQAIRKYPSRFLGYVVADPWYTEELEKTINHFLDEPGFVGIKLHPELHDNYPMKGPRYEPVWAIASERRIPVLFHTYFGGDSLEDIALLAAKYPSVPLLVGHELQDKGFDAMAELANSFRNIYIDFSAPEYYGLTEFFVDALDDIKKLLFGTDFPWGNCYYRVAAVVYARIPKEAKRKILGENFAELLGLNNAAVINRIMTES
jgi:predicted TIM-barrel fold metal-dependent hydrolase